MTTYTEPGIRKPNRVLTDKEIQEIQTITTNQPPRLCIINMPFIEIKGESTFCSYKSIIEREEYFIKKFEKCDSEDELDDIIKQMRKSR